MAVLPPAFHVLPGEEHRVKRVGHFSDVAWAFSVDFALLSFLAPTGELSSLDQPTSDGTPMLTVVSAARWRADVGSPRGARGASAAAAVERQAMDARARRERELREGPPFAFVKSGIAFLNWSGSHATWRPEWEAATAWWMQRSAQPDRHWADLTLARGYLQTRTATTARVAGYPAIKPNSIRLLRDILHRDGDLRSIYVIRGLDDARGTTRQLTCLYHHLAEWIGALDVNEPRLLSNQWVLAASAARLADMHRARRVFLYEFLDPGLHLSSLLDPASRPDYASLAYSNILRDVPPEITALGIAFVLRPWTLESDKVRSMPALVVTLLHELAHALDTETGVTSAAHGESFYRAFQYIYNVAYSNALFDWWSYPAFSAQAAGAFGWTGDSRAQLRALDEVGRDLNEFVAMNALPPCAHDNQPPISVGACM
jgi:hypothetical protein